MAEQNVDNCIRRLFEDVWNRGQTELINEIWYLFRGLKQLCLSETRSWVTMRAQVILSCGRG